MKAVLYIVTSAVAPEAMNQVSTSSLAGGKTNSQRNRRSWKQVVQ